MGSGKGRSRRAQALTLPRRKKQSKTPGVVRSFFSKDERGAIVVSGYPLLCEERAVHFYHDPEVDGKPKTGFMDLRTVARQEWLLGEQVEIRLARPSSPPFTEVSGRLELSLSADLRMCLFLDGKELSEHFSDYWNEEISIALLKLEPEPEVIGDPVQVEGVQAVGF